MGDHPEDIAGNDGNRAELACSFSPAFRGILKSDTFVDKSGLILAVLNEENEGIVLYTAPRRFGKTVNLSMLQKFLELEVDENGKGKTTVLEDKDNYKLFKSARSELIVMRNKKFVETHFGQYPVIKLNFLCRERDVKRLSDAVMVCRNAIGRAFTEHSYLYKSNESPLKHFEKKICERWCDILTYKVIPDDEVIAGLARLAEYLNKFHKKKVFLLVDEYDSIVSSALYNVEAADRQAELKELECIAEFSVRVIGCVKDCSDFFQGAYITGILDIGGIEISCLLGSLLRRKFGTKNLCQDFYGFNEKEVRTLFNRWGVDQELQTKAMAKYNGYNNGALKLYNPFSIVQFLNNITLGEGALKNYWQRSGYIQNLYNILRQDDVRHLINELLQDVKESVDIDIEKPLQLLDLKDLHDLLIYSDLTCDDDIVYQFLVSLGYLTYSENDGKLKIPNGEVTNELQRELRSYFYRRYGINKVYAKACSYSFSKLARLCGEDDSLAKFKVELANFQNKITCLFQQSNIVDPLNEATVQSIITVTCARKGFLFGNEIHFPNDQRRVDVILYNDTFGCVVGIKCDPKTVEDALKQIFASHYYNVFTNTKYFNDRQKTPSLSLVMGLHVDSEKKVSVRCLRRKDIANILDDLNVEADPSLETRIEIAVNSMGERSLNTFCEKATRVL